MGVRACEKDRDEGTLRRVASSVHVCTMKVSHIPLLLQK